MKDATEHRHGRYLQALISLLRPVLWLLALLPALAAAQQPGDQQSLTSFVDRNEVSVNEVLTLTIRVPSSLGNSRPTLSGLDRDFVQLGVATHNTYATVNGRVMSWTEYRVSLKPRTTGNLTIPAFRVGGEATRPIVVNVGEADDLDIGGYRDIFLSTAVSKDAVYVQEQLLFTVRLYYDIGFNQGAQLTTPQVENSVVQQLGSDQSYQELVDGIRYNVVERKFVIFPQASGELVIPPVYFNATVGRRGLSSVLRNQGGRQISLASDTHQVNVLPRPASFPGQTWLPARNLVITEEWSGDIDDMRVGDSLTRNILIRAEGLSSSLLPGIAYADIDGLKFYPDQPVRQDNPNANGITGSRAEGTAIVPSESGDYLLPEIRLPWWNTEADRLEMAVIPARTLRVMPGANPQPVAPPSQDPAAVRALASPTMIPASQTSGLYLGWISATVVFAAAWLATTALWLRSRRQLALVAGPGGRMAARPEPTAPDLNTAFRELERACAGDDLREIRQRLITWGQAYFNNRNIRTLDQLRAYCANPTFGALLFNLERALYGEHPEAAEFRTAQLLKETTAIHNSDLRDRRSRRDYRLPPLYRN